MSEPNTVVSDGLRGSLLAAVTPLTAAGEVHDDDVVRTVRRALEDGASGVLVAGSTGEGASLSTAARAHLTVVARGAVDDAVTASGRPPLLLAGASGATVADLDADVARLAEAGADAVLVLAPATYPLTPDELADLHLGVADRAEVATLAYHIPQLTGSALTPDAWRRIAEHPGIVGMKDSSPDADRRGAFAAVLADRDDVALVTGHAPTLRAALEAGVAGSITAIANVRQRQVVALHRAVADADGPAADRLQGELARTTDAIAAVGVSTPAALKAALQLEGAIEERWCVPPLASVPPARLDRVRTALLR